MVSSSCQEPQVRSIGVQTKPYSPSPEVTKPQAEELPEEEITKVRRL